MMNMAEAMIDAAVVVNAVQKVRIESGREAQREKIESGLKSIEGTVRQAPVRNRANIQCEALRTRSRASTILEGRATGSGD